MKKTLCIFLAAVMLLALTACGSSGGGTETEKPAPADNTGTPAAAPQPAGSTGTDGTDGSEGTSEPETPAAVYTLADEVIVDDERCAFKITSVDPDGMWDFTLKSVCENKTADESLTFSFEDVSVNGYMIDPLWAASTAAGKKNNSEITFSKDTLSLCGIKSVDEIEFRLRVYDSDSWDKDPYVNDFFRIYPTGKSAAEVEIPPRPTAPNETVVVSDGNFEFVVLEPYHDDLWGSSSLRCYIENKTDKAMSFAWDDVSVNGYSIDQYWGPSVAPGKRAISSASFSDSTLSSAGISSLDKLEFTLRVHDANDWNADPVLNEAFTVYPTGKSEAEVVIPGRPTSPNELVFEADGAVFVVVKTGHEDFLGYTVTCYLENDSDKKLTFQWDDVSVNGFMIEPYWSASLLPGKRKVSTVSFSDSDLTQNGIDSVEDIEFKLRVRDCEDWFADDIVNEVLTYRPVS